MIGQNEVNISTLAFCNESTQTTEIILLQRKTLIRHDSLFPIIRKKNFEDILYSSWYFPVKMLWYLSDVFLKHLFIDNEKRPS